MKSLFEQRSLMALPVRPRPVSGEAAMSYVSRVAASNGYSTLRAFHAALSGVDGRLAFERLRRLLDLTEAEITSLRGPMPAAWDAIGAPYGLDVSHFNLCWIRWCPLCLATQGIVRWEWTLKTATACLVHGVSLRDACDICGSLRRWNMVHLDRCNCGARLAGQSTLAASTMVVGINRVMAGLNSATALPLASPMVWFRAIVLLERTGGSKNGRRSGKVPGLNRLQDAQTFVVAAASLFEDWPRAFEGMLWKLLLANAGEQSIQRTFDPLYRTLYKELRSDDFDFVRQAFEKFLREHWWGLVSRRNRRLGDKAVQDHPRVTASQAAALAATRPSTLNHVAAQSVLFASEFTVSRSGRRTRTLHIDDVRLAAEALRGARTLTKAAALLALPEKRVRQLIDGRVISTLISRRACPTAAAWLIPASELVLLDSPAVPDCGCEAIALRAFLRYERLDDLEVAAFVSTVVGGAHRAPGSGHCSVPLGEVLLDRMTARAWLTAQRCPADLSIDEAARRLGTKQQVAYALAKEGLLEAHPDGRGRLRVTPTGVIKFEELYVPLSIVARGLGTSPKAALGLIQARPVCGPGIDSNRQYFYRRTDIPSLPYGAPGSGATSF